MTHRERVAETIRHREPDRVPAGEWGIDHDHVAEILGRPTFWRNRTATTLAMWENRRDEVVEGLKRDCAEFIEKLDYDVVTVELVPPKNSWTSDPPKKVGEGVWRDSRGNEYKYSAGNDSIMALTAGGEGRTELADGEAEAYADARIAAIDDSCFELIDYIGDRYGKERAVLARIVDVADFLYAPFGGNYEHKVTLPLLCGDAMKSLWPACVKYNRFLLERCRGHNVLIAMQGHDFGMNTGCIISPGQIRDVFMPAMRLVNAEIEAAGMIPFFHCCGNVWDIMDDFVSVGYKGYQSIQESAGMDNATMKRKYGADLTLWTGVQCETMLTGTPEEAEAEINRNLEILMPGGGFIFGSTNSVQFGAKTENYLRALDIVHTKGIYK